MLQTCPTVPTGPNDQEHSLGQQATSFAPLKLNAHKQEHF
jgi:hypothetical protein